MPAGSRRASAAAHQATISFASAYFSRADPVVETSFHERRGAGVHKWASRVRPSSMTPRKRPTWWCCRHVRPESQRQDRSRFRIHGWDRLRCSDSTRSARRARRDHRPQRRARRRSGRRTALCRARCCRRRRRSHDRRGRGAHGVCNSLVMDLGERRRRRRWASVGEVEAG